MPGRDGALLLAYRLRPLGAPALTAGLLAVFLAGLWMVPSAPPSPPEVLTTQGVTLPLGLISLTLALAAGFVGGRDVDIAEHLLFSAPVPYWRVLLLRLFLWGAASAAVVWLLAGRGAAALETAGGPLRDQALVYLLFGGALTFVAARLAGPVFGGGAALSGVLVLSGMPLLYEDFPLQMLASPASAEWDSTATALVLFSGALLVAAFFVLRRTSRA